MTNLPSKIIELLNTAAPEAKEQIRDVAAAELLAPHPVCSTNDAMLVKAGLYLKHGFLDESHRISQGVNSPTGSYWHGIMHRHEGDISNSHYWYERVGQHPVLEAIGGYPRDEQTEQHEFDLLLSYTVNAATGRHQPPRDTLQPSAE